MPVIAIAEFGQRLKSYQGRLLSLLCLHWHPSSLHSTGEYSKCYLIFLKTNKLTGIYKVQDKQIRGQYPFNHPFHNV